MRVLCALRTAEALAAAEAETRTLKGRLEAMGPVNMMALEEFAEASTRHEFLEAQRKDLLDSIANTQGSIKEIDEISNAKFDEAFAIINAELQRYVCEAVWRRAGDHEADRRGELAQRAAST